MLELVGYPVAVNPDRALKKLALERGWEIRSFKDPAPLFQMPGAKEIGIGAGLLAGVIALITAGTLLSKLYAQEKSPSAKPAAQQPILPLPKALDWKVVESWFKKSSA